MGPLLSTELVRICSIASCERSAGHGGLSDFTKSSFLRPNRQIDLSAKVAEKTICQNR